MKRQGPRYRITGLWSPFARTYGCPPAMAAATAWPGSQRRTKPTSFCVGVWIAGTPRRNKTSPAAVGVYLCAYPVVESRGHGLGMRRRAESSCSFGVTRSRSTSEFAYTFGRGTDQVQKYSGARLSALRHIKIKEATLRDALCSDRMGTCHSAEFDGGGIPSLGSMKHSSHRGALYHVFRRDPSAPCDYGLAVEHAGQNRGLQPDPSLGTGFGSPSGCRAAFGRRLERATGPGAARRNSGSAIPGGDSRASPSPRPGCVRGAPSALVTRRHEGPAPFYQALQRYAERGLARSSGPSTST